MTDAQKLKLYEQTLQEITWRDPSTTSGQAYVDIATRALQRAGVSP